MSDRLYLRYKCTLLLGERTPGHIIVDKSLKNYSFSVSRNGQNVNIKLLQDGKTIEAESIVDFFKPTILQILRTNDYDKLSVGEKKELSDITHPIREAVRQFAGLLKQELHRSDIRDELIGNVLLEWSLDNSQWHSIPVKITASISSYSLGNMNKFYAKHLQKLLSENEKPLVATIYLHQARNAESGRYQWIYATIAAELAIKEILARMEPNLQVILSEVPSPPLNKLYGVVLESVAGVKSEGLTKLQDGARIRNKLVHRPESVDLSFDKVNDYIDFIEKRIRWLLSVWRKTK